MAFEAACDFAVEFQIHEDGEVDEEQDVDGLLLDLGDGGHDEDLSAEVVVGEPEDEHEAAGEDEGVARPAAESPEAEADGRGVEAEEEEEHAFGVFAMRGDEGEVLKVGDRGEAAVVAGEREPCDEDEEASFCELEERHQRDGEGSLWGWREIVIRAELGSH